MPTELQLSRHGLGRGLDPADAVGARAETVRHRRDDVIRAGVEHHPRVAVLDQMGVCRDVDRRAGRNQHIEPSLGVPGMADAAVEDVQPIRVPCWRLRLCPNRAGDAGRGHEHHDCGRQNESVDSLHGKISLCALCVGHHRERSRPDDCEQLIIQVNRNVKHPGSRANRVARQLYSLSRRAGFSQRINSRSR